MATGGIQLADGVWVEPMCGEIDVDCRLLFIGDRYRQLLRAFPEAVFRMSRDWPLDERRAYLHRSAEIAQFYEITRQDDRIALHLRDDVFFTQAPLEDLDLSLIAAKGSTRLTVPLSLDRLKATGLLLRLLCERSTEHAIKQEMDATLSTQDASWTHDLLRRWSNAGLVEPAPTSEDNAFLKSPVRPRVTFMGHSSLMLQSRRTTVLTDPLFRTRLGIPAFAFDSARLPLGAICCSHSHWDHCDITTLLNFDKRTTLIIPRVYKPSAFNPPVVPMLQRLGFVNIREIDPWDRVHIDDIEIVAVPFHGEQDEPDAVIDHYTYVLQTEGLSVYGGVDAYQDTYGEMLPVLERVRRDCAPDIAFLPVSRMTYAWKHGGVNGFCRDIDTTLIDQWFQYTASAEQAVDWARALGAKRVSPYATFNFSRYEIPTEWRDFDVALQTARMGTRLLPLRPFDAADPSDVADTQRSALRREYLLRFMRARVAATRLDKRFKHNLTYRLAKRLFRNNQTPAPSHH